jgi:Domain of unknown function (DUF4394)/Carbohydrate binding module (family 6)
MAESMKIPNTKKAFTTITVITLVLGASLTYGSTRGHSVNAKSAHSQSNIPAAMPAAASSSTTLAAAQTGGITMPQTPIYALNSNNTILVLPPGATSFTRLVRVTQANGNLIGIDFRPGDGKNTALYALTDTGTIYTINLTANGLGNVTKVSDLTTRFPSGVQSLADFNPVVNALRLIGSDRLNYAVVNSGGNLNAMAIQTSLSYDPNDVNSGVSPHVSAGTYDSNIVGAATTRFYGIDYDLDTFVTTQPATPGGSSATGGGVLQTLGPLVTPTGQRVNISSTADIDIHTILSGDPVSPFTNFLYGVSGQTLFTINLSRVNPNVPAGSVANIVTRGITMPDDGNNIIDIALAPSFYQAENATLGGGATIASNFPGFSGTGYVSFGDSAGSSVEFQVNQNVGLLAFNLTYANGSNVERVCNIEIDGSVFGVVRFPPTGSWTNYSTALALANLGTGSGFHSLRITSTNTGGPNLDRIFFNF